MAVRAAPADDETTAVGVAETALVGVGAGFGVARRVGFGVGLGVGFGAGVTTGAEAPGLRWPALLCQAQATDPLVGMLSWSTPCWA